MRCDAGSLQGASEGIVGDDFFMKSGLTRCSLTKRRGPPHMLADGRVVNDRDLALMHVTLGVRIIMDVDMFSISCGICYWGQSNSAIRRH